MDFSANLIESLPDQLLASFPRLKKLHIKSNRLVTIPPSFRHIEDLDVSGNSLSEIHPSFRSDKEKVSFLILTNSVVLFIFD